MQRLIKDAAKLDKSIKANDMSFGNIVKAINVVQTEMGITGTTAKEAASTISGSTAMMKASWSNLAVEMSKENGNIEGAVNDFVDSLGVMLDNVMPRVDVTIGGIVSLVDTALPKLMDVAVSTLSKYAPKFVDSGVKAIKSLLTGMKKNSPQLTKSVTEVVKKAITGIAKLAPDAISVVVDLASAVIEELPDIAFRIMDALPSIMEAIANGVWKLGGSIIQSFTKIFSPESWMDRHLKYKMEDIASAFTPLVDVIGQYSGDMSDFSDALSTSGKTISDLDDLIELAEGNITSIIKREFEEQDGYRQKDIDSIRRYVDEINKLEAEKLGIYRSQQTAELRKLSMNTEKLSKDQLLEYTANANTLLEEANKIADNMYTQDLVLAENYYRSIGKLDSEEHKKAMADAKAQHEERLKENRAYYNAALAGLSGQNFRQEELISRLTEIQQNVGFEPIDFWESLGVMLFGRYEGTVQEALIDAGTQTLMKQITGEDMATINEWLTWTAMTSSAGGKLSKEDVQAFLLLIEALRSEPDKDTEAYQAFFSTITSGLNEILGVGDIQDVDDLMNAFKLSPAKVKELVDSYGLVGDLVGQELTGKIKDRLEGYNFLTGYRTRSNVSVVQNIYSQPKSAADLMAEALYQQQRAVLFGG